MEIAAIHANEALSTSKGRERFRGKSAIAQKETAGPPRLVLYLGVEGTKRRCVDQVISPFCFEQIDIVSQYEAAVDLLAHQAEGSARRQPVCIEHVLQELFECIAAGLWVQFGHLLQVIGKRRSDRRINSRFCGSGGRHLVCWWLALEPFNDPQERNPYCIVQCRIVVSHAAGFTVLPKRIQRIKNRFSVRLSQVIAQALRLAPALNRPTGIVDIDPEFFSEEFSEGSV